MKKVLIIEDELSIAELERDYLEINGFLVDIEVDGETGLSAALNKNYNLIILDVMLPKVDGFEICRQIRNGMDVPILMVSAKKEDIDKIRGLGLGADDYITKPFSPGELVARVKAHIARYERLIRGTKDQNEIIEIKGLSIYPTSRRVYVNGNEVILTAKEFDILTILALNPNKVFSKDNIFEKVWGMDSLGDIGTVTVHIRKLREKIEVDPSNPKYIETIWGVGYRFEM
ncbi:response regulator transcription factor [Clostridium bowmanii]|uniref:response regulator transcription factor n=1 Tax=Clostridium bowmanii TaxID=132925 RepID=UPI001C0E0B90|nr:response regulator transcription factor [Clostridium bowmanii]MBU3189490.1 response regulator transcription factor [Clostridium bowmanii]MCA1074103.1 response regulator transcription factor [Clostridium bowmanii]